MGERPGGKIPKSDVTIAKYYLIESELEDIGRIVNACFYLAEGRAKRHIPMTMEDWAKRLDLFLSSDDREILRDSSKILAKEALINSKKTAEEGRGASCTEVLRFFAKLESMKVLSEGHSPA